MSDDVLAGLNRRITGHVERLLHDNQEALHEAARRMVTIWRDDGLLYAAGAGHSIAGVIETFFRAGGLAHVRPLWDPEILPLHGAIHSTAAERDTGRGRAVARAAGLTARDGVVVFSNSGVNPYPVEIAREAHAQGAWVLAITSRAAAGGAPNRSGALLHRIADTVVDTAVPPGDVAWPEESPVTAPLSSVCNAAAWSAVLALCHELEPGMPWWVSANVPGPAPGNGELLDRYGPRIPELLADAGPGDVSRYSRDDSS